MKNGTAGCPSWLKLAAVILAIACVGIGAAAFSAIRLLERQLTEVARERSELLLYRLAAEFADASPNGTEAHRLYGATGRPSHQVLAVRVLSPRAVVLKTSAADEIGRRLDVATADTTRAGTVGTSAARHPRMVRLARPLLNEPRCLSCHGSEAPVLGFVSIDVALEPADPGLAPFRTVAGVAAAGAALASLLLGGLVWFEPRSTAPGAPGASDVPREAGVEAAHSAQFLRAGRLAAVGEIATSIAHEVKNPLAGIGAAMHVLARGFAEADPRREVTEEILAEVKRLQQIVRGLLDTARAPTRQVASDLHDPLQKVLFLLRPVARAQGTTLVERLAPDLPLVPIDAKQMQQVLLNIGMNALQAVGRGGEVSVSTAADASGRWVEVSFRDSGPGIPLEARERIFESFYTTKREGTGLGLTMAREIVASHGGEILVDSAPGQETSFTVRLFGRVPRSRPRGAS